MVTKHNETDIHCLFILLLQVKCSFNFNTDSLIRKKLKVKKMLETQTSLSKNPCKAITGVALTFHCEAS